ncbi:MAG: hypothetical protein GY793_04015, partial [Proteobacteria bacterium]|nr:hypothetical protein [Pseudomonadota bacterium]
RLDNSALEAGRSPISFRKLNSTIDPQNMSYKEYVNYLCFLYDFNFSKGWDGIERRPHVANWSEDLSHNIQTKEEALAFIDMAKNSKAPDGIEKREQARRKKQKDYRKAKPERRMTKKQRRREDLINNIVYYLSLAFLLFIILAWVLADVLHLMEGKG